MDTKKSKWEDAYKRGDNVVFYPDENFVRFISRNIKKKIGPNKFIEHKKIKTILDLGCGMGRHVCFLDDMGYDVYGIDLSETAITLAKEWFEYQGRNHLTDKVTACSATNLPFESGFFDFIVSYSALDGMHFELAKECIKEASRVLKSGGIFYIDLYAVDLLKGDEKGCEGIVEYGVAEGTVRSYFDVGKTSELCGDGFKVLDHMMFTFKSLVTDYNYIRTAVILEKK